MRRVDALAAAMAMVVACGAPFQEYEYEEDLYLSLDGSATLYVNSSVAALNLLRGTAFDLNPGARPDGAKIREFFSTPVSEVRGVTSSRRNRRRFVHVRLEVRDVRLLGRAAPFAWSAYQLGRSGDLVVFRQTVSRAAAQDAPAVGLTGRELVAFRLHLPSTIVYHNAPPENLRRGNILVWEQPLDERLRGAPLTLEARIETQSILSRTLLLFAATLAAVAVTFAAMIGWLRGGGGPRKRPSRGVGQSPT